MIRKFMKNFKTKMEKIDITGDIHRSTASLQLNLLSIDHLVEEFLSVGKSNKSRTDEPKLQTKIPEIYTRGINLFIDLVCLRAG